MAGRRTVQARKFDKAEVRRWRELDQKWKEFDWIIQIGKRPADDELLKALNTYAGMLASGSGPPEFPTNVIKHVAAMVGGTGRRKGQLTTKDLGKQLSAVREYMLEKGSLKRAPKNLIQGLVVKFGIGRKTLELLLHKFPWPGDN